MFRSIQPWLDRPPGTATCWATVPKLQLFPCFLLGLKGIKPIDNKEGKKSSPPPSGVVSIASHDMLN